MNRELEFLRKAETGRLQLWEVPDTARGGPYRAILFVNQAVEYARIFEIQNFPLERLQRQDAKDIEKLTASVFLLEDFIQKIKANNVFELEPALSENTVVLDDEWRTKISSYVAHIRKIVMGAEIEDGMRDAISKRLNALQEEVDRSRTRLEAATAVWLKLTEAIGAGAENLEPAVKLLQRVSGAISRLSMQQHLEAQQLRLPAPDTLGLNGPDDSDSN